MAKDVVIFDRCDGDHEGEPPTGSTVRVNVGSGEFEAELCEDCKAALIDPIEKLKMRGRLVEAGGKVKLRCPWCSSSLSSAGFLRAHVEAKHPDSVGEFVQALLGNRPKPPVRAAAPEVEFVEEVPRNRRTEPRKCPHCGQSCGSPQGLGAHLRSRHGIQGSSESAEYNRARQAREAE